MSRYRYNAEPYTLHDGQIDFGASVPFAAQVRPLIVLAMSTGWRVRCYRKLKTHVNEYLALSAYEYKGEDENAALLAFDGAISSGYFEFVELVNLTTNTIIKDHSE